MLGKAINSGRVSKRRQREGAALPKFVRARGPARGFTLLELMIVIFMIMILASIAIPSYNRSVLQSREAVLRSNLNTLRNVISQYTLDKRQAPQTLDDLKTAGYLHEIPIDPITRQADWETDPEDTANAADPQQPGIGGVHSHSNATASDGTAYNTW